MNWKDYECEILNLFRDQYPEAQIKYNAQVPGRYSKVNRQIDVLIEDYIAGTRMRIVVDGKYFNSKIDVKDVEMFIGMLNDVGAHKGLMITQEGYSDAAINRAYNDQTDLELDILNFKELQEFQGFVGLPYAGENMAVLPAPFGWVIDASKRKEMIATLYQRGLTFEEAFKRKEWAYVNFRKKDEVVSTLEDLLTLQEKETQSEFPTVKFSYLDTIIRKDFRTKLRRIDYEKFLVPEYTGFIEFDDYFFFCVMFTREELTKKNIRKLESILLNTQQGKIDFTNSELKEIDYMDSQILIAESDLDKSDILCAQGNIYFKNANYESALKKYDESLALNSTSYGALIGKIKLMVIQRKEISEFQETIDKFFTLGTDNPTVCQNIVDIFSGIGDLETGVNILKNKCIEFEQYSESSGNFNFHIGLALETLGKKEDAKLFFLNAKEAFARTLPKDHEVHSYFKILFKRLEE